MGHSIAIDNAWRMARCIGPAGLAKCQSAINAKVIRRLMLLADLASFVPSADP